MGCDIHFFVERFDEATRSWVAINMLEAATRSIAPTYAEADRASAIQTVVALLGVELEEELRWDLGRDYALFGILAGVRDDSQTCIDKPRGSPDDMSGDVKTEIESYGTDGHSHSHLTLVELQTHAWPTKSRDPKYPDWIPAEHFSGKIVPLMAKADTDPSRVRCVFFFDN